MIKEKACRECDDKFTLSDKQIEYYEKNGFKEPERCLACRRKKRIKEHSPCVDCGNVFTMNGLEIEFYEKRGLKLPKRCPECRKRRKGAGRHVNDSY